MQSFILENFGESFKQKKNQGLTTVLHVTFSHISLTCPNDLSSLYKDGL